MLSSLCWPRGPTPIWPERPFVRRGSTEEAHHHHHHHHHNHSPPWSWCQWEGKKLVQCTLYSLYMSAPLSTVVLAVIIGNIIGIGVKHIPRACLTELRTFRCYLKSFFFLWMPLVSGLRVPLTDWSCGSWDVNGGKALSNPVSPLAPLVTTASSSLVFVFHFRTESQIKASYRHKFVLWGHSS